MNARTVQASTVGLLLSTKGMQQLELRAYRAALAAAASAANAGSGGGGGGATLQLSCAKGCAVRGCNFTGNAAPGANGGGLLANVSCFRVAGLQGVAACAAACSQRSTWQAHAGVIAGRQQSSPAGSNCRTASGNGCTDCQQGCSSCRVTHF